MRRQGEQGGEGVTRPFAGGSPQWSWEVAQAAHTLPPNSNSVPSGYAEPHKWCHSEAIPQGILPQAGQRPGEWILCLPGTWPSASCFLEEKET